MAKNDAANGNTLRHTPKPRIVTSFETITTFEEWRHSLVHSLSSDPIFARFIDASVSWTRKSKSNPTKGFVDDSGMVPQESWLTSTQKVIFLELMLEYIARYTPVIAQCNIVRSSTSLSSLWQTLHQYYGFHEETFPIKTMLGLNMTKILKPCSNPKLIKSVSHLQQIKLHRPMERPG